MFRRKPIAAFLCWFVLVYGLLLFPWPGVQKFYAGYFRVIGQGIFHHDAGLESVNFEAAGQEPGSGRFYTQLTIANRNWLNHEGVGPMIKLKIDTRLVGWAPTALVVALIAATPISWRRRGWALFWGLLCIHGFIFTALGLHIWYESAKLSLVTFSQFWAAVIYGVQYTLYEQMGARLVAAALIWIAVTFRASDLKTLLPEEEAGGDEVESEG